MLHDHPDFDVIAESEFLANPTDFVMEDELDMARCIWDGNRMVTEEEFAAEMAGGALALA